MFYNSTRMFTMIQNYMRIKFISIEKLQMFFLWPLFATFLIKLLEKSLDKNAYSTIPENSWKIFQPLLNLLLNFAMSFDSVWCLMTMKNHFIFRRLSSFLVEFHFTNEAQTPKEDSPADWTELLLQVPPKFAWEQSRQFLSQREKKM